MSISPNMENAISVHEGNSGIEVVSTGRAFTAEAGDYRLTFGADGFKVENTATGVTIIEAK